MTQLRRSLAVLVALLVGLVLAGCGALDEGGSSGDDSGGESKGETTVKVGYLHTIAVDDKLWLGQIKGHFADQGLKIEATPFDTGIAVSQALAGGSIDVAIMGGVTSNFPAQGQGRIFMVNSIEKATAQLWVNPKSGIESVADLKGQTVTTTEGTTADIFLLRSLQKAGLKRDDVKVANAVMPDAVQAFVSGAAPAIATWVPFDLRIKEGLKGATMIDDAGNHPTATVADGWIANNDYYDENPDVIKKLIRGWLATNEEFRDDPEGSLKAVYEEAYAEDAKLEDIQHQFEAQTDYSNEEWAEIYENGDLLKVVGGAEKAFVELGGVPEYVEPSEFFDTSLFVDEYNASK